MGKIADFSHHNGNVDWSQAKDELDLAIIRVQCGSKIIDKKYKEYVAGCKKYGIPFAHYAYARFVSVSDAIQEAKDFLSRIDKDAKFLVVDVEEVTVRNKKDLVPATQAFIDTCKKEGWKVGLYTGHSFYFENGMDKVKADFLWIPRYAADDKGLPHENKPSMRCDLWQYTQRGRLKGVQGYVDLNMLVGDKTLEWFIVKTVKSATKTEKKANTEKKIQEGIVTASALNVRAGHSTKHAVLGVLKKGEKVRIGAKVGDWYSIYWGHHGGWVHSKYIKLIQ